MCGNLPQKSVTRTILLYFFSRFPDSSNFRLEKINFYSHPIQIRNKYPEIIRLFYNLKDSKIIKKAYAKLDGKNIKAVFTHVA